MGTSIADGKEVRYFNGKQHILEQALPVTSGSRAPNSEVPPEISALMLFDSQPPGDTCVPARLI